ncbi:MAG: hypothetical protein ACNFW9_00725 [Candidatus Kerfeldbacteria bacterium]|jgi:hypothetical protein
MKQQFPETIKNPSTKIWIIFFVIIIALVVGVYFYFVQTQEEWNISIININTTTIKKCSDITDENECSARKDCRRHDLCPCNNLNLKCGVAPEFPPEVTCDCFMDGFEYCEDLMCDGVNATWIFNGPVSRSCEGDSDCKFVDNTINYSGCCRNNSFCPDYSDQKYVAVNKVTFNEFRSQLMVENDCDTALCPVVDILPCPEVEPFYEVKCLSNLCVKQKI